MPAGNIQITLVVAGVSEVRARFFDTTVKGFDGTSTVWKGILYHISLHIKHPQPISPIFFMLFLNSNNGLLNSRKIIPYKRTTKMNYNPTIAKWTRKTMRCNNHDDLLHLSFTLKISVYSGAYYNLVENLWWSFSCQNSKPLSIFTKKLHCRCSFGF